MTTDVQPQQLLLVVFQLITLIPSLNCRHSTKCTIYTSTACTSRAHKLIRTLLTCIRILVSRKQLRLPFMQAI